MTTSVMTTISTTPTAAHRDHRRHHDHSQPSQNGITPRVAWSTGRNPKGLPAAPVLGHASGCASVMKAEKRERVCRLISQMRHDRKRAEFQGANQHIKFDLPYIIVHPLPQRIMVRHGRRREQTEVC
jgi:hypothetical protein